MVYTQQQPRPSQSVTLSHHLPSSMRRSRGFQPYKESVYAFQHKEQLIKAPERGWRRIVLSYFGSQAPRKSVTRIPMTTCASCSTGTHPTQGRMLTSKPPFGLTHGLADCTGPSHTFHSHQYQSNQNKYEWRKVSTDSCNRRNSRTTSRKWFHKNNRRVNFPSNLKSGVIPSQKTARLFRKSWEGECGL